MRLDTMYEFVAFAHTLNVSYAAKLLNMSQSGLSRHLSDMEKEIGVQLISREKDMSLTPAGILFLSAAENIIQIYNNTILECKNSEKNRSETIILQEYGGHPDVSAFLFALVGYCRTLYPDIVVEWKRFQGSDIAEGLLSNQLDVAQIVLHESQSESTLQHYTSLNIEALLVKKEDVIIWLKVDNYLAKKEPLRLKDLENIPIRMTSGKLYNPMRNAVRHLFYSRNLSTSFEYAEAGSFSDFYLSGAGNPVFILPPLAVDDPTLALRKDMVFKNIEDVSSEFITYFLFCKQNNKRHVQDFMKFVKEYLEEKSNQVS